MRVKLAKCCTALSESPMAILRVKLTKCCTALSERPMAILFMWLNPFKELRKINVVNLFEGDKICYLYIPFPKLDF